MSPTCQTTAAPSHGLSPHLCLRCVGEDEEGGREGGGREEGGGRREEGGCVEEVLHILVLVHVSTSITHICISTCKY